MASILKSQAAFEERAKECGLAQAELDVLVRKGLTSLSLLAFSVSTPGEVPQEAELRSILDPADPTTVPLRALSALRRLMFEAQTLSIAQLKSSIEGEGERKAELAPAERANRLADQRKRLIGLSLTGPLENAFSNYTYVAQVVDQDCLSYLEPHRFLTRAMEVNREKPGKELILDEGSRMSVRDKAHKDKCGIQNELQLSEALCRRALACDLLQLCTFASMDMWHRHLLAKLSEQPPPYYAKVSMEQLLRCDKAAWVRMSELLTSLKKDDSGNLPMDAALDKLQYDPKIMMHLAPLPGAKWKGDGKGEKGIKRDADGKPKLPHRPNKGTGKGKCPDVLSDSRLKHNCSKTKKRLCWNFNLQAGCKFAKAAAVEADSFIAEAMSPPVSTQAANHACMLAQSDPVGPLERPKPASSVSDRISNIVIDERVFPLPAERRVHASLHPAEQFAQDVLSSGEPVTATCVERLFNLLPSKEDERFSSDSGRSFVAGVFRHGGVVGLTNSCRSFPQSVSLAITWAMQQAGTELSNFTFCSISLNLNVKTEVHRDVNNDDADNLVLAVTSFSGGHIWVQSESGSHALPVNGTLIPGVLYDVAAAPVRFYARKRLHCTMPWTGDRLVWQFCWSHGVFCSIAHPSRSIMWLSASLRSCQSSPFLSTSLRQCMFGSYRRKATRILHTVPFLQKLGVTCDGGHDHEPWRSPAQNRLKDAGMPPLLCKTFAQALVDQLVACGARAPACSLANASLSLSMGARVATATQPSGRKIPPLVPEFARTVKLAGPADQLPCTSKTKLVSAWAVPNTVFCQPFLATLPPGSKCLRASPVVPGGLAPASEPAKGTVLGSPESPASSCLPAVAEGVVLGSPDSLAPQCQPATSPLNAASATPNAKPELELLFGIPWSPSEFVKQACKARHPRSLDQGVPAGMSACIERLCEHSSVDVARERTAELRKWMLRKKELDESFDGPEHCKKILAGKPMKLFGEMVKAAGHADVNLVRDIQNGFDLLGEIPSSSVLPKKTTVASLSVEDVRIATPANQRAIWEATRTCRDPEITSEVYRFTLEERDKGWLTGPFTLADVPETAIVTRRFGVRQGLTTTATGVAAKIRPIDDFTESLANLSCTCAETIDPHSVNIIVAGILKRCRLLRKSGRDARLLLRTIDLRKAYKQLPLSERALGDAYICVLNPNTGEPELYQSQGPSGRWGKPLALLHIHWSVFFDDYVVVASPEEKGHLDLVLRSYFGLLGWETSDEKDAGVQNTEARKRELVSTIESIVQQGGAHARELECLRGRLQFAESQVFGRGAAQRMRAISKAMKLSGFVVLDDSLTEALLFLKDRVLHGEARMIRACDRPTYHLFTDASYEADMPAGLGGILYSDGGLLLRWYSESADTDVLEAINQEGKQGLIYELEACAAVQGVLQLCNSLNDCNLICYCDNEAALAALIKCASESPVVASQLNKLSMLEDEKGISIWFERRASCQLQSPLDPRRRAVVLTASDLEWGMASVAFLLAGSFHLQEYAGNLVQDNFRFCHLCTSATNPVASTLKPVPVPLVPVIVTPALRTITLNQARLRAANAGPPEDGRARATQRFKVLILINLLATRAGKQMTDLVGRCSDEARALQILTDTLAPKSTGTITKRSGALWRYAAFLANRHTPSPFCAGEDELYQYLQRLRGDQCTSTASSLLEALRFAHGMFGLLKVTLAELDSPRVKGAAHSMFVQKKVRVQAPPIPVPVILKLLELASDDEQEDHISLIAGQILVCVFGVGRWSDFRAAHGLEIDIHEGIVVWRMYTAEHKTAITKEAKTRLLPFVGLGHWPNFGSWISRFDRLRTSHQIEAGLPSWDQARGQWHDWPMSSSEATAWLREFAELVVSADEAQKLRSHSCKHTLLNWAGGSGLFTREERTLLGHHVESSTKSATTYDANTMLALQAKVLRMITAIHQGDYDPDAPMARRLQVMAAAEVTHGSGSRDVAPLESSEAPRSSSSEDDGAADPGEVLDIQRDPLPEEAGEHTWFRHVISSIVHVAVPGNEQRLKCGRLVTCNFQQVDPRNLDRAQSFFCVQCSRQSE
ncbi:unnamed protein product [Symbiodinium sp. CCMP2592]|nr:unnamed protein product [Symbiodinium sp. CCMP2592]